MDFCSKVAMKLLLEGIEEEGEKKNMLSSPLSYNAIMNMIAAGSSNNTLVQILQFLEHRNIEEVNSESSKFAEITGGGQTRKASKRKIDHDAEISSSKRTNRARRNKNNDEGSHGTLVSSTTLHQFQSSSAGKGTTLEGDGDGDGPTISFLNGVWVNNKYRLKNSFQELLGNLYKAKARNIDCGKPEIVVQETNEWASASSNGLIKEVLRVEHIGEDTALILGNSLYFKGSWNKGFKKSRTKDENFYLLNGEKIKAPFMTGCKDHSHKFFRDFQVARIPYQSGDDVKGEFAMYIFLPYEEDGLEDLLKDVNANPEFFRRHCALFKSTVDIFYIPKFKFSFLTEKCPNIMKDMGLTLPFDKEMAEFYEMVEDENLLENQIVYVSNIIQKTFVEVNEEGTEAAAVTTDRKSSGGMAPGQFKETTKFIADHPFMFIIRGENSGIMFFVGTLLNPLKEV